MVRRNQLVLTVVRLATLNRPLSIYGAGRELIGPVHPVDTRVDVVLIGRPNLQDAGNPIIIRFAYGCRISCTRGSSLALDGRLVRDEDKALAIVFGPINYGIQRLACRPRQAFALYSRTKLL